MRAFTKHSHTKILSRFIVNILLFTFTCWSILPPFAAAQVMSGLLNLPASGQMVTPTQTFSAPMIYGMAVDPVDPLKFEFFVHKGDQNLSEVDLRIESQKLIKYFLATLTTPEEELWVNLSPYEKDRIISDSFGVTEMGRDMLAQDYLLKQLTASLTYPEEQLGKKFWKEIYQKAKERFGADDIPLDNFHKVWIVPERAKVYENNGNIFIVDSRLKVMMESDYQTLQGSKGVDSEQAFFQTGDQTDGELIELQTRIMKELIIPEIEREVNEGKTFANLRQIFHSMILATWYKQNFRQTLLGKVYIDQRKVAGVDVSDKQVKEKIYQQYLAALKKGVFNYIKEDYDSHTQQVIPHYYFSGGVSAAEQFSLKDRMETTDRATRTEAEHVQDLLSDIVKTTAFIVEEKAADRIAQGVEQAKKESAENVQADDEAMLTSGYDEEGPDGQVFDKEFIEKKIKEYLQNPQNIQKRKDLSEKTQQAIDYLGKEGTSWTFEVPVYVVSGVQEKTFGAAVYADLDALEGDGIYIEEPFLKEIEQKEEKEFVFDMKTRIMIRLLAKGSILEKRKAEYHWAEKNFPEQIKNLWPRLSPEDEPTTISILENNVRSEIIPLNYTEGDIGKIQEDLGITKQEIKIDGRARPSSGAIELGQVVMQDAREALYEIGVNALNRNVHLNQRVRLSDNDSKFSEAEQTQEVTMGMLAFAADPPTLAHTVIASLKAMAKARADVFAVSITWEDYRKSHLVRTYRYRKDITDGVVERIFRGLIKSIPAMDGNGEERVQPLMDWNKELKRFTLLYGAGGDHFYSFARNAKGKVKFARIKPTGKKKNFDDFSFYVKKGKYKELLNKLLEYDRESIPTDKVEFIERLAEASSSPNEILRRNDVSFPVLDTVGKLWLIQAELSDSKQEVGMVNTSRQKSAPDAIRDYYLPEIRVVANKGVAQPIAATHIRNALRVLPNGRLDLDGLRAVPREILKELFQLDNRPYLRLMIRKDRPLYAMSLEVALPDNLTAESKRQDKLKFSKEDEISAIFEKNGDRTGKISIFMTKTERMEKIDEGKTEVEIKEQKSGRNLLRIVYSIQHQLDENAEPADYVVVRQLEFSPDLPADLMEDVWQKVREYVIELNSPEFRDFKIANSGEREYIKRKNNITFPLIAQELKFFLHMYTRMRQSADSGTKAQERVQNLIGERLGQRIKELDQLTGMQRNSDEVNGVLDDIMNGRMSLRGEDVNVLKIDEEGEIEEAGFIDIDLAERLGYLHPAIVVLVLTPDGKVVTFRRDQNVRFPGHLSLFARHRRVSEDDMEAAAAEIKRRIGLRMIHEAALINVTNEIYDKLNDQNKETRNYFFYVLSESEMAQAGDIEAHDPEDLLNSPKMAYNDPSFGHLDANRYFEADANFSAPVFFTPDVLNDVLEDGDKLEMLRAYSDVIQGYMPDRRIAHRVRKLSQKTSEIKEKYPGRETVLTHNFSEDASRIKRGRFTLQVNRAKKRPVVFKGAAGTFEKFDESLYNFDKAENDEIIHDVKQRDSSMLTRKLNMDATLLVEADPSGEGGFILVPRVKDKNKKSYRKLPHYLDDANYLRMAAVAARSSRQDNIKITYASLGTLKNINQLHFHGLYYGGDANVQGKDFWWNEGFLPIEQTERVPLATAQGGDVIIERVKDYPANALVFSLKEGKEDVDKLAETAFQYVLLLNNVRYENDEQKKAEGIPYDILINKNEIIVIPQKYGADLSVLEMAGEIMLVLSQDERDGIEREVNGSKEQLYTQLQRQDVEKDKLEELLQQELAKLRDEKIEDRLDKISEEMTEDQIEERIKQSALSEDAFEEIMGFFLQSLDEEEQTDAALLTKKNDALDVTAQKAPGGIDFNPALFDLQIKRDGNGIPLPIEMQSMSELMSIDGFVPIIIDISPVTSIPFLLGQREDDASEEMELSFSFIDWADRPKPRFDVKVLA